MSQPSAPERPSPPWLFIFGLLLGGGLLVLMAWDSISAAFSKYPGARSEHVITLTDENWEEEVVNSKVPVLVDFWAPWCGPCRALSPTIDKLAVKYDGKVKVGKLNVDDAPRISARYDITGIPRVLIFNGGAEPQVSFMGVKSEAEIARGIEKVLARK